MYKQSARPFPTRLVALGFLVLLIGGALLLLRSMHDRKSTVNRKTTVTRDEPANPYAYRNRAILPQQSTLSARPRGVAQRPSISGYVYSAEGQTLEGALVSATTFELAGNLPSLAGTVKSDRGGHFEIPLAEGTYQVNANLEGYGPTSATVRTGDIVSLVLPASGTIAGKVVDEQNRPVTHFSIDVISAVPGHMPAPAPLWSRTFDSADGTFRVQELPEWSIVVRATAQGYSSAFSQPMRIKAKETKSLDLTLKVGCSLAGVVEDKSGAPAPYVLLDAEARIIAGSASENSLQSANQVQSDPSGRFHLDHVPTGTVLVRAYDGAHAVTTTTVQVQSCDKLAPLKITLSVGGGVAGTAKDGTGKPLAGVSVSLAHRSTGFVNTRTDEQGRFRFERLPPAAFRMELHYQGQRTLDNVVVKEGEVTQKDIVLFARGRGELRGRVTAGGRPLAGVRLLIASGHGKRGVDTYYPITGPDGSYRLTDLAEGLYLVGAISTMKGQGIKVPAGGVVTVDLDVSPRPEPPQAATESDKEDQEEGPLPLPPRPANSSPPPAPARSAPTNMSQAN